MKISPLFILKPAETEPSFHLPTFSGPLEGHHPYPRQGIPFIPLLQDCLEGPMQAIVIDFLQLCCIGGLGKLLQLGCRHHLIIPKGFRI